MENEQQQFQPPPLPPWLLGLGSLLLNQELSLAIQKPQKNFEKHLELAAAGLGL
jgi:hypothetical protein